MAGLLSEFREIEGLGGIWSAKKGTLRCTAIKLKDGSLCLFSPVAGLDQAVISNLLGIGDVKFLLAPNHYHNKGLEEYVLAFGGAELVAPEDAIPRLTKVTGLEFSKLDKLFPLLPDDISVLTPIGLKTGEIWLRISTQAGITWIVVDAFCTKNKNPKRDLSDIPEILGTFPKMGVMNHANYREWVNKQLLNDQPNRVLPCHGSIIFSDKLTEKLTALMRENF